MGKTKEQGFAVSSTWQAVLSAQDEFEMATDGCWS
jgi:hypothetical protein